MKRSKSNPPAIARRRSTKLQIEIGKKKAKRSVVRNSTRASIRRLVLFRPVFIESFREGRRLVIGAESPRRRPHRSLLHLAARRFTRAILAGVESRKQGWRPRQEGERAAADEAEKYSCLSSRKRSPPTIFLRGEETRERSRCCEQSETRRIRACHRR